MAVSERVPDGGGTVDPNALAEVVRRIVAVADPDRIILVRLGGCPRG
jgi:hypothetical protein